MGLEFRVRVSFRVRVGIGVRVGVGVRFRVRVSVGVRVKVKLLFFFQGDSVTFFTLTRLEQTLDRLIN